MRARTAAVTMAVGGLLVVAAVADAVAVVLLARGKSFLGVGGVRVIALGLAAVVALAGGATMARARVLPRPGRGVSKRLRRASLVLDALVVLSLPALSRHVGTGRFCAIGGGLAGLVLLAPFALLFAVGLHVGAVARARDLVVSSVGVLLAAAPLMVFVLARLADRITCGD